MGHWALVILLISPISPISLISPTPHSPKIHISTRMMIERGQKPDRFSYQQVKTGEDESPGYWW
ncbi:MAG: hypothetical protein V7L05_18330 [Nostoc sp.]|uniref:hypothetical protein n=1 Tax=Nostoc sp. TaxID=1180 RepID=UPI002FF5F21C